MQLQFFLSDRDPVVMHPDGAVWLSDRRPPGGWVETDADLITRPSTTGASREQVVARLTPVQLSTLEAWEAE